MKSNRLRKELFQENSLDRIRGMKILRKVFLLPVYFYRAVISPMKGGACCGYTPTCSAYFIEAVDKHGIIKGAILGTVRILRCRPSFFGGYDPVPDEFSFKGIKNQWKARKKPKDFDNSLHHHSADK